MPLQSPMFPVAVVDVAVQTENKYVLEEFSAASGSVSACLPLALGVATEELVASAGGEDDKPRHGALVADKSHAFSFTKHPMFLGIFDGHGGDHCSTFISKRIFELISGSNGIFLRPFQTLRSCFLQAEAEWLVKAKAADHPDGSTAAVAVILGDWLYVAGVGDTALVLGRNDGKTAYRPLPVHRPYMPAEKLRLAKHHPRARPMFNDKRLGHPHWNAERFHLGVSRAFGDLYFKDVDYVTEEIAAEGGSGLVCLPDIWGHQLTDEDDFLVMCCDGVWDVLTPEVAVEAVRQIWAACLPPKVACTTVSALARANGGPKQDDKTVMVVYFRTPNGPT